MSSNRNQCSCWEVGQVCTIDDDSVGRAKEKRPKWVVALVWDNCHPTQPTDNYQPLHPWMMLVPEHGNKLDRVLWTQGEGLIRLHQGIPTDPFECPIHNSTPLIHRVTGGYKLPSFKAIHINPLSTLEENCIMIDPPFSIEPEFSIPDDSLFGDISFDYYIPFGPPYRVAASTGKGFLIEIEAIKRNSNIELQSKERVIFWAYLPQWLTVQSRMMVSVRFSFFNKTLLRWWVQNVVQISMIPGGRTFLDTIIAESVSETSIVPTTGESITQNVSASKQRRSGFWIITHSGRCRPNYHTRQLIGGQHNKIWEELPCNFIQANSVHMGPPAQPSDERVEVFKPQIDSITMGIPNQKTHWNQSILSDWLDMINTLNNNINTMQQKWPSIKCNSHSCPLDIHCQYRSMLPFGRVSWEGMAMIDKSILWKHKTLTLVVGVDWHFPACDMVRLVPLESEATVQEFIKGWSDVYPDVMSGIDIEPDGINCLALIYHDRWVLKHGCWLEKCQVLQEEYVAVEYCVQ